MLLVSVDKYPSKKVIVSSDLSACMSQQKELKENNNSFGYLFDVNISWIFFKT